jgi:hypothetical protein
MTALAVFSTVGADRLQGGHLDVFGAARLLGQAGGGGGRSAVGHDEAVHVDGPAAGGGLLPAPLDLEGVGAVAQGGGGVDDLLELVGRRVQVDRGDLGAVQVDVGDAQVVGLAGDPGDRGFLECDLGVAGAGEGGD